MSKIQRSFVGLATVALLVGAPGCSTQTNAPDRTPENSKATAQEAPAADSEARTIQSVLGELDCTIGGFGVGGATVQVATGTAQPKQLKQGTCKLAEGSPITAFFEYGSAEDALLAASNGSVEAAAPDKLFTDGSVLIWTRDATSAARVSKIAMPVP